MKLFIACLGTETHTFSAIPTGLESFRETMLFHGDGTQSGDLFAGPLRLWRDRALADGMEVVESLAAFAEPGGPTVRQVYEDFRAEILADLAGAGAVDMVLLNLHGAMVADGYDDCEGDLTAAIRAAVGEDVVIGVELDLHCSLTRKLVAAADVIVTFKEYPHVDVVERAAEVYDLALATQRGEIRPVMAVHDCRMVHLWRTPFEPMRGFVDAMSAAEGHDGILSVSFAHGFPWGNVPETTARMLVVADCDGEKARATAADFAGRLWAMREETRDPSLSIDAALDRALAAAEAGTGPVVLADTSDNAGCGAPSDATFILAALLERGLTNVVSGVYWDPVSVRFCREAGEGAVLNLRIGGKCGPSSGAPVDLRCEVRAILTDARQPFGRATAKMGDVVWLRAAGIDLVINSKRTQTFHPQAFEQLGIDLNAARLVVVKSTQHFHAGFAPVAAEIIYVGGPGATAPAFAEIPLSKLDGPFWPKDADPFQAA
ncbi:MAG: M81 family metallopeptidase [Pseudomonadota bacterium]|nr:M81 family metallopeptidase [Pseudomonadota bacterium]